MDENVPTAIALGLRKRGIDVLTVQEDQRSSADDVQVPERAAALGRVVFTNDADFLVEAARRQHDSQHFAGIVYALQRLPIGQCVDDLEVIASICELEEYVGKVVYLPL